MVVVLVAGAAVFAVPWWTHDRAIPASVPAPNALFAVAYVGVSPGQEACFDDAAIESHSDVALVRVATGRRPGPPLRARLSGGGWSQTVDIAGGYADGATVRIPLTPPRGAVLARVCLADRGSAPVQFFASADRTVSRAPAEVGGKSTGKSIWFALYERRPESLLSRLGVTAGRVEAFRPGFLGRWLLYLLAAAVMLGMPLAVVAAYGRAVAADEPLGSEAAASRPEADAPLGSSPARRPDGVD
jgi:hypothetical protein